MAEAGSAITGNAMSTGRDDGGKREWSPRCGIAYSQLENGVIEDNVMHQGALEELLVDPGHHGPSVIVADNPASPGHW